MRSEVSARSAIEAKVDGYSRRADSAEREHLQLASGATDKAATTCPTNMPTRSSSCGLEVGVPVVHNGDCAQRPTVAAPFTGSWAGAAGGVGSCERSYEGAT